MAAHMSRPVLRTNAAFVTWNLTVCTFCGGKIAGHLVLYSKLSWRNSSGDNTPDGCAGLDHLLAAKTGQISTRLRMWFFSKPSA